MKDKIVIYWILVLLSFILLLAIDLPKGFLWDVNSYARWNAAIKEYGFQYAYEHHVDYPPTMVYFLAIKSFFYKNSALILSDLKTLKIITFLFSAINGYLIYKIVKLLLGTNVSEFLYILPIMYLFNPAIFFNSIIWGQVDEIAVSLILLSFYYLIKEQFYLAILFGFVMINFKIQTIVVSPFLFLFYFYQLKKINFNIIFKHLIFLIVLAILFYLPFVCVHQVYRIRQSLGFVGTFPKISMMAYNVWYFFYTDPVKLNDDILIFNFTTLKSFSILLFFTVCGILILHYNIILKKTKNNNYLGFFLLVTLSNLLFYFLLTQMHERYSHFAFCFLLICCGLYPKKSLLIVYILLSFAYFINLLQVMIISYPKEYLLKLNVVERIVSLIYLMNIIILVWEYFIFTSKKTK